MTFNAEVARHIVKTCVGAMAELTDELDTESRVIDGHDDQAARFIREHTAVIRSAVSQLREQAKRIGEGSVVG